MTDTRRAACNIFLASCVLEWLNLNSVFQIGCNDRQTVLCSKSRTNTKRRNDTRNRIIHGYDSVSNDVIWLIATRFLPELSKEIKELKK